MSNLAGKYELLHRMQLGGDVFVPAGGLVDLSHAEAERLLAQRVVKARAEEQPQASDKPAAIPEVAVVTPSVAPGAPPTGETPPLPPKGGEKKSK